ncbi:hypothetical protein J4E06_06320 [Muricauda sp. NFXS6]|uniref:hypothetical protein n=1 Tax=Allomuricauda sp. NFXS6 TaxID=2819094 RepID=UPI0032DFC149
MAQEKNEQPTDVANTYRGGVLAIGSLFWDNSQVREKWRAKHLLSLNKVIDVNVPIRYGRNSKTREGNYTMVFSKAIDKEKELGIGKFMEFQRQPRQPQDLIDEAMALIKAECMATQLNFSVFNWKWGTVGICLNPKILEKNEGGFQSFLNLWRNKYGTKKPLKPSEFKVGAEEEIINDGGVINLRWPEELDKFDYYITTLTKPELSIYPSSKEVAQVMTDSHDETYFRNNRKHGIITFQDEAIEEILNDFGESSTKN